MVQPFLKVEYMSFRKYGGADRNATNNIVRSHFTTSDNLNVTRQIGDTNTNVVFKSDIKLVGASGPSGIGIYFADGTFQYTAGGTGSGSSVTGPTGPTGPQGFTGSSGTGGLPPAGPYGSYLYSDGSSWQVDSDKIHLGTNAGFHSQGLQTIAIGVNAGYTGQGLDSIAIGTDAGSLNQDNVSIAIGRWAGAYNQKNDSVAVGFQAGYNNQGGHSIAVGYSAGGINQKHYSVALGYEAGLYDQSANAIAIGHEAGHTGQQPYSIAVGFLSGQVEQSTHAISIGTESGRTSQGENSIAIGYLAGETNQEGNSIVINATGIALNNNIYSSLRIKPIRPDVGLSTLKYNASSGEITYDTAKTFVIDHPLNPRKHLVHGCLEGPEGGVYYRGKAEITNNESTTIILPEYVDAVARDFTVQLTQIHNGTKVTSNLQTSEVENGRFVVYGSNCKFFWLVHGKRCDIDVEPDKSTTVVKGSGPYRWI